MTSPMTCGLVVAATMLNGILAGGGVDRISTASALGGLAATTQATPKMLSLRRIGDDPAALRKEFEGFERWGCEIGVAAARVLRKCVVVSRNSRVYALRSRVHK